MTCRLPKIITKVRWTLSESPNDRDGATEIAGVDNVARAKKQELKTREWTSRHEEAGMDIARVDNV